MTAQAQGDLNDVQRRGGGSWIVPAVQLPAVGNWMHDVLPNESYDPHFHGQLLETTYFDTLKLELRKNRRIHERYITLRLRCYDNGHTDSYALSVKTEEEKWRLPIANSLADGLLEPGANVALIAGVVLPGHLLARLMDASHEQPLMPVVKVCCRRYAVENKVDRYTLDVGIHTSSGRHMQQAVLEYKSTDAEASPPSSLLQMGLCPIKLSKFLWATEV